MNQELVVNARRAAPEGQIVLISPLPQRTIPYPWEDLASLLCRTARKMGYADPRWILSPRGSAHRIYEPHVPTLCWREDYQLLIQQLLLDEYSIYKLTAHQFAPMLYPEQIKTQEIPYRYTRIPFPLLSPEVFRRYFLDYPLTRVCPECLAEEPGYDRIYWRFRDVFFCPIHRVLLRERCPRCRMKIPALRLDPFICSSCLEGDYRLPLASPLTHESYLQLSTLFFLCALGVILPGHDTYMEQAHSPLNKLERDQYFELLTGICSDLSRTFRKEKLLAFNIMLQSLSSKEVSELGEGFITTDVLAPTLFHWIFFRWPVQFFSFLDLISTISEPIYTCERIWTTTWFCKHCFYDPWPDEPYQWLRRAVLEHDSLFRYDEQLSKKTRATLRDLSNQSEEAGKAQLQQHMEIKFNSMSSLSSFM